MSRKSKLKQQKKILNNLKPLFLEMAEALDTLQVEAKALREEVDVLSRENEFLKKDFSKIISLLQRG